MDPHDRIRPARTFATPQREAYLGVLRTAAELEHAVAEMLKPYGITHTQYSVLRILRAAGSGGLCRNGVRDRMIARVPDATRLLDRMEAMGLIIRERDAQDRRYVTARITIAGLRLLDRLDSPVRELHGTQLAPLDADEVRALIDLLDRVRGGGP